MFSISEISSRRQFFQIKQRWDNILSKCSCQAPYLSFEWYHSALETIDKDKVPLLLFFTSSGKDIGLVPLVYKKLSYFGFTYYHIGFVYNPYTPYQAFIYQDDLKNIITSLIGYLRKRFGTLFYLDLDEIRLTPQQDNVMRELASNGLILFYKEEKSGSRYLILNETFEQTLNDLQSKTRKEFRRKIERLSKLGYIDLIRIQGADQIEQHLDHFFRLYARTWKGEEPQPEFYYRLCKEFDNLGKLYFYALTIGEQFLAYLISLRGTDTIYGIKTTYDPSYYAFSPGVILFYKFIANLFSIYGIREFDIGRGDEQFKREWTSLSHEHTRLLVYPNTLFWNIFNRIRCDLLGFVRKRGILSKIYSRLRPRLSEGRKRSTDSRTKIVHREVTWDDYKEWANSVEFTARFAQPEDLDRLTVAMSAHSFKDVQEHMNQMQCILILDGTKILAYFWISSKMNKKVDSDIYVSEMMISDWGLDEDLTSEQLTEKCVAVMLRYLKDKGLTRKGVMLPPCKSRRSEDISG